MAKVLLYISLFPQTTNSYLDITKAVHDGKPVSRKKAPANCLMVAALRSSACAGRIIHADYLPPLSFSPIPRAWQKGKEQECQIQESLIVPLSSPHHSYGLTVSFLLFFSLFCVLCSRSLSFLNTAVPYSFHGEYVT
jgi:hypothetical protein